MKNILAVPPGVLAVGQHRYRFIDLKALLGDDLPRLPVVLRLLLENVQRNMSGSEKRMATRAVLDWLSQGTSQAEIPFQPGRVLMHDTTSTPALVDIAGMRDALAEAGIDPAVLSPTLPVDVSVDHSLAVEVYAQRDAAEQNLRHEMRRNKERYRFLRWASHSLKGVHINPPGTGIMHTINLEQLATVVKVDQIDGMPWAVPDMMIGTDSHTPMINGIGVLGWGVGGLEAQTVMFGMPTMLRIPDVIGVRLTNALRPGVLATDLALTVTQRLRAIGVSGEFVEFHGPGVATLTAGERAVVANMAPEYGATTGYFPVDEHTLDYLRQTGRDETAIELVRTYMQHTGLWFDPDGQPRYTRTIDIDLGAIDMHVAGPRRPQDLLRFTEVPASLRALDAAPPKTDGDMPRYPVAIAAITSCTNTSDPGLLIAAALVARNARARGLRTAAWVKTSLGPGSPAAASYLKRAGLLDDLEAMGFGIVGYGCTTCIGNSGPLPAMISRAAKAGTLRPVAMLSGNRNFPGRIHPDLDLGFLMSPPLVVAYALAGDAERNLGVEPLGTDTDGTPVYLSDLWPTRSDITACLAQCLRPDDFPQAFRKASRNPIWDGLDAPASALFPWDPASTTLRRPPFASLQAGSLLGSYQAYPLLIVGDDVTTDHISPASAIPPDSLVADYLIERGEDRHDLNVFASRRGNWEVMLRGAFHSKTLVNRLWPDAPVAHTLHVPSGDVLPLWVAAERYRQNGDSVVLVAGERYGTGSSRDWAAKVQRLLGVRAVLALSFERIHRSNLIGMGILPLRLPAGSGPDDLALQPGDRIEVDSDVQSIKPRGPITVRIVRGGGQVNRIVARAAVETQLEVELLKHGGVMPAILHQSVKAEVKKAFAPTGVLRAAINLGNPILAGKDPDSGEPCGVSVDLARALAERLGVDLELVVLDAAGKSVQAVASEKADVGFFAVDPERGAQIAFTAPYVLIEGAYLVKEEAALRHNDQVDHPGVRVAVGQGSAYDLYLSRALKQAEIVRAPTSPAVVDAFLAQGLDVAAGVKQQLEADARRLGGLRLLPGRFMVIRQAMGLPKSRGDAAASYLSTFIEEMKASGQVGAALERHGIQGASVAPPGE